MSFLGRAVEPARRWRHAARDLVFDKSAFLTAPGSVSHGEYLLSRAKGDPSSFGSSLVLSTDKIVRQTNHAKPARDENGNPLPPLWRPLQVHSVDFVDNPDAAHSGFLSAVAGNVVSGDATIRLRQSWRRTKLANESRRRPYRKSNCGRIGRPKAQGPGIFRRRQRRRHRVTSRKAAPPARRCPALISHAAVERLFKSKPWSSLSLEERQRISRGSHGVRRPRSIRSTRYFFPTDSRAALANTAAAFARWRSFGTGRARSTKAVPAAATTRCGRFYKVFSPAASDARTEHQPAAGPVLAWRRAGG